MSRPEIEDFASEDVGFRLATAKDGLPLLGPIDFDSVTDYPLHLLAVGHTKNIYAVSNTSHVGIGKLRDLDDATTAKLNLHSVELPCSTFLSLNSTNESLYAVSAGNVHVAAVKDILADIASPFKQTTSSGDVISVEASPAAALVYFYLKTDKTLTLSNSGTERTIEGVNAAAWQANGQVFGAVSDSELYLYDASGNKLLSHELPDAGRLSAISSIDPQNWFVVGTEEDADPTNLLVHADNSAVSNVWLVFLTPPFGDADRAETLYSASVADWKAGTSFAFITSALSTDISTVECGEHTRLVSQLNDTDRAELPMDDDSGDDTLPVGFALDLSSTELVVKEPCQAVEEAVGVLPRLLCLNNLGNLLIWYVFDSAGLKKGDLSLTRALDSLRSAVEAGAQTVVESKTEPVTTPKEKGEPKIDDSLTGLNPADHLEKPATGFGSSGFGSSTSGSTGFGASGFGSSGFGTSGEASSKPAFGSSGFGSSGFGASGFGSSGFGLTGFGSSGFGQPTAPEKDSNSGAPAFGKSSFGTSQPTFGATSSFGSSGFGSKPVADSSSKPSNFASFGSTSASFSSSKAKDSPFGSIGASKESPFGSTKPSTESPFGSTKPTESPFGSTKPTESPFGSTKPTESPFGSTRTSAESPFGSTKPTESPFGTTKSTDSPFGSTKPSTESPFGTTKPTESPFGSTKPTESPFGTTKSTESPFGTTKPTESPFGSTKLTESSFGSAKTSSDSPFGTLKGLTALPFGSKPSSDSPFGAKPSNDSPFGSFKPSTGLSFESTKAPTPSLFGRTEESAALTSTSSGSSQLAADESDSLKAKDSSLSQVDNPFDRLKISESQAPDDEAPASEYVANSESDWASTEDESDVEELNSELVESNTVDGADSNEEGSDEGEPEAKGSDKEASMPTFGDLKIGSKSSPFDILKTGQAAEKLEEAAKVDGMPKFAPLKEDKSIGQLLPKAESSLPKFTTDNAIRGSTDSNEPSATPKPSSPQSSTVVKPADTEEIKDHKLQDKNTQSQEDEVEEASEILSLDQEEIIEVPEIRFEPLLSFNGWTSEPAKLENQISDKIASLLARSQGEATILRQNVKIIDRLIDTSEFSAITLEEDDLEYPTRWTLGNIDRITELAKVLGAEISEKLDTLRQQDKSLSSIVELAGKCEVNQEQLGRIVSQIAVFKQEVESARLINRPLDVRAQSLCSSLRKKLRQVQEQHETALEKMVQLSLKQQANREFVDKLEQVVFEIHARAKQYNDEIASLEAQLLQMPAHESASPVTLMLESGSYSVLEAQKKRLAAKFANGTTTRKVEISPN